MDSTTPATKKDADVVEVYGVKNGELTRLGTAPMPAKMKARELAREQFGHFVEGDGSDGDLCMCAMEMLIEHMEQAANLQGEQAGKELGWSSLPATLDRLAAWLRNPANADGCESLALSFAEWCQAVVSARAALLAMPHSQQMTWQPIETAPKDGTEMALLFARDDFILGKAYGRVRCGSFVTGKDWAFPYHRDNPPTHWMSLTPATITNGEAHG